MSEEDYHRHPSLSSSGARKLLAPSCPARFKYEQDNPPQPKTELDIGKAAHRLVLGTGPEIVELRYKNWMSNDVKRYANEAREAGKVPLLTREYEIVHAMAAKLRTSTAFNYFTNGAPEVSAFWTDPATRVNCRARFDWLPNYGVPLNPTISRLVIPDLKTSRSANPADIEKSVYQFGYYMQAAWYIDAAMENGMGDIDTAFVLVVQEKTPPYLVSVVQIDPDAIRYGRERNHLARETFRDCKASGIWPDYMRDRKTLPVAGLPGYATYQDEEFDE
jgi:hypothetical protein